MVRIVKMKYIDEGIHTHYYDGLKYLFEEKLSQYPCTRLQEWREKELWT